MNLHHIPRRTRKLPPLRVGIGGPVGSGKTTLLEMLCKAMRDRYDLVAGPADRAYGFEDNGRALVRIDGDAVEGPRLRHGEPGESGQDDSDDEGTRPHFHGGRLYRNLTPRGGYRTIRTSPHGGVRWRSSRARNRRRYTRSSATR